MNANTAIVALSDGLYDSMVALRETAIEATLLDAHTISDNGMDISTLHTADEMKLYGEKADIFLNWVCQGDPARAAAMVRGFELKLYTLDALQADLVPGDSALLNPDKICLQVQEKIRGYMQVVPAPPEAKIAALKLPFAKPRN